VPLLDFFLLLVVFFFCFVWFSSLSLAMTAICIFRTFCRKFKRHLNLPLSLSHKYYDWQMLWFSFPIEFALFNIIHVLGLCAYCNFTSSHADDTRLGSICGSFWQFVFKVFELLSKLDALPVQHFCLSIPDLELFICLHN